MKKVYILSVFFVFVVLTYGIDLDGVKNLMENYRLAFNSGNPSYFDTILSDSFTYSGAEPELSKMVFKSIVELAPYSISKFFDITISPIGKDSAFANMEMEINYGAVKDTVAQTFIIVEENGNLRIGAIIESETNHPKKIKINKL